MENRLKQAKKEYKNGEYFYSATKNVKSPIEITEVVEAKHEDRVNEIKDLKEHILSVYRNLHPTSPKNSWSKLFSPINVFETDVPFFDATIKKMKRLSDLESMKNDIINENGGVIWDNETGLWAEKY